MVRKQDILHCGVVGGPKAMKAVQKTEKELTQVIIEISRFEIGKMLR